MNAIQDLAVKRIKAKNQRDDVAVGDHPVDFTVRVKGFVRVGEDNEYTPTAELPPLGLMTLAMRYCGVTREALAIAIAKAANEANREGKPFRKVVDKENEWAREMLTSVRNLITFHLDKKTRKGAITGKVMAELVELVELVELENCKRARHRLT